MAYSILNIGNGIQQIGTFDTKLPRKCVKISSFVITGTGIVCSSSTISQDKVIGKQYKHKMYSVMTFT